MYSLNLVFPVLLSDELARIAEAPGCSSEQIRSLAGGNASSLGVVIPAEDRRKKAGTIRREEKQNDPQDMSALSEGDFVFTGAPAVLWLCRQKNCQPRFITRICIPDDMFSVCSASCWYALSSAFFAVSRANDRLARLAKLHAPDIILRNEIGMLWKAVEALEYGTDNGFGGLNAIGYSLLCGWYEKPDEPYEPDEPDEEDTFFA